MRARANETAPATRLDGEVAAVTGASRGIGRAIARAFADAGAAVALAGRDRAELESARAEVEARGARSLAAYCDVRDPDSVDAFGDAVREALGPPTVVVACAGVAGPTKPLHELAVSEWEECVSTDLTGVFLTFRRFIPAMLERGAGSLIAISSMTGKRPLAGRSPYAAAKLGVIGLVRTLALELGPFNIRVNSVCPGGVDGPRIDLVLENQARLLGISVDEARRQMTEPAALKRLVRPEEVASACVFLASAAGSGITGEDLNVTAGLVMY
ncbi:MAG TPA: SDR family NAD(P)-dependent oxidoreductase [Acidimicrobiales bacterium]|nr:SDR family NAD(P)-dependent oxidoreductase [Acidimicrobiales bacterium]